MDKTNNFVTTRPSFESLKIILVLSVGLTQSTISSWYRKNMLPSIPSLTKICDAFGISISQFFLEDSDKTVLLNDKQLKTLNEISKLNETQSNALLNFLKTL